MLLNKIPSSWVLAHKILQFAFGVKYQRRIIFDKRILVCNIYRNSCDKGIIQFKKQYIMKKLFLLFPVLLLLTACEQLDIQSLDDSLDPLPEEIATLKKETAEDLGMSKTQENQLHKGFAYMPNSPKSLATYG